ncbi:MAG: hypothetical protein JNL57_11900 [Bacteroidetes bacterium]|nr:hypothetical protein [Bacteroidota bacterium]
MIAATSLELFKNLAQYDYNNQYYDFHNDFNCEKIYYSEGTLLIILKKLLGEVLLSLKFTNVKITTIAFSNVKEVEGLTIDTLYRGKAELNGELIEVSEDGEGYFYLEFYEGQKLEFWAKDIGVEQE